MPPELSDMEIKTPVIFYCNHAYWWDGFWSQLCTELFFRQNLYIIIEYPQLVKFRFFTRVGAFSIDRSNPRSAVRTLEYAAALLSAPGDRQNALWIFPQGRIEHVDKRPIIFYRGTADIAERVLRRNPQLYLVSLVSRIEYLEEQKPELFLSFAAPQLVRAGDFPGKDELTHSMQQMTERHLDELKSLITDRKLDKVNVIVRGRESINRKVEHVRRMIGVDRAGKP
jgi:chlorobactene lauroyltransferase